jgi:4-aminobutyrate aminotransferase
MTAVPVPERSPSSAEWLARDAAALAGVLPRCSDIVAVRGAGSWLFDADGQRYLDFASGIAVTNTGHCHPRVVAAIAEQAAVLLHTSVVTHHTRSVELAERLGALCPFFDEPQVFFCNSGAEAVDGALKLARRVTGRGGVIAFRHAFHGRTLAATTLTTAKDRYQEGYQPLLPGVRVAPYGEDLAALDALVSDDIGTMVVEPVLGEGGYVVPPVEWLAGLRERATAQGALLVFDEVQCGMGRTGRPFAAETFGVAPDVLLFAKGVASGLPLGGIIAGRALMERWPTGTHGSTFGGNPLACAAALATLDVLEEEDCYRRARVLGKRALGRLRRVAANVRGVGLMIGVELPDKATAARVREGCLAAGLIVLVCGPEENVLRLMPPLTISDEELDLGLSILEHVLRAALQ